MRVWVWIPARGGSQSIPRKNIRMMGQHPLIAYSIIYAKQFDFVEKILVSTDDEEIASIAIQYGAELTCNTLRPAHLAGNYTRDEEVLDYIVRHYESINQVPDWWVQLRPTYPFRPMNLLRELYETFMLNETTHAVRTIVKSEHPPMKMYRMDRNRLVPLFQNWEDVNAPYEAPRQLLPTCYWHNGCIDIIKHSTFLEHRTCFPTDLVIGYEMDRKETWDIDTEEDWKLVMKQFT